ncbi:HAD hydrolase-like protein [Algoriphagus marincola]|uniref:phosphoglycolate phosphatase n=1 Tax=Algoriphagus marincola TaxID=264027 RepID=A0ABS7N0T5_9BACT|nr:HAD hydrolase-like protein [Algoriphagus marincola]MBY5949932.1 HAD hydrolase-like protein [Algoriphagus marincola]
MKITSIFWDFDGVILDSMNVRDWGFREIFKDFRKSQIEEIIQYHRINGGLSRYVKIRYFYEKILGQAITEEKVLEYANKFSELMKMELIKKENLIQDTISFIEVNYHNYNFHIVSGSDQNELRYLCSELGLSKYFVSIHGSPTPKFNLVETLMRSYKYEERESILIGDSLNDFEAAKMNKISFYGYNNLDLMSVGNGYIESFEHLNLQYL